MPVINPILSTPSGSGGMRGPCSDWPVQWTCELSTLNPAVTGIAVATATETLYALTGMRFGLCEVTLRPCRDDCTDGRFYDDFGPPWTGQAWPQPALIGGLWFNLTCGSCTSGCGCVRVSEVRLPAPVYDITEVVIDGEGLDSVGHAVERGAQVVHRSAPISSASSGASVRSRASDWRVVDFTVLVESPSARAVSTSVRSS